MNLHKIPADGIAGLKENFTKDALAGFLVFLLALPLSMGVAKAADFPPIFGVVSAIIGGIVVSFFAGSRLSIKGPAAGLISIGAGSVAAFGGGELGWKLTLGAIVVAGIIQIIFGVLKLGKYADLFPSAAVHGMLAAIGIIIMSKQLHLLLGISPDALAGKGVIELLLTLPESISNANRENTIIGLTCLAILFSLNMVKHPLIKKIPAPLVVLVVAIPMGIYFQINDENAVGEVANYSLVKIGSIFETFKDGIWLVDFSGLWTHTGVFIQFVILFLLIGSIESLLTAKAIDLVDPYRRKSDFNKDLSAVGIGNVISGIMGGQPMISEVARSSANVSNGAVTRWSNFFHGLFMLLAVIFAVPLIEMIPNTALSAMLVFVGFNLAHPKEFTHIFHIGKGQFVIFVSTVVVTLLTDLLAGVAFGIALKIIINMMNGAKVQDFLHLNMKIVNDDPNRAEVEATGSLLFTNNMKLGEFLEYLQQYKEVNFNFAQLELLDHTSLATILKWKRVQEDLLGMKISLNGLEEHSKLGHSEDSVLKRKKRYPY
ncbi:MAG: SulP family inorganic anion transporter [Flavobacteriaceae bacterium]|nr:SulP family inorganic anion transporter [Flavobacteriaceae bacterium]